MVHMAMKVERQLKRNDTFSRYRQNSGSSSSWKQNWRKKEGIVSKTNFEPPKKKEEVPIINKGKSKSQTCNRDIKCFHCLGVGHIASQCPNKRTMIMRVNRKVGKESESEDDQMLPLEDASDNNEDYAVEGELLVVRRALNVEIKEDDMEQQRQTIFHTRCHVNSKVCSMIIHGRSCTNVASTTLVEKLNFPEFQNLKFKIPCDMNFELGGQDSIECRTKKEDDLLKKDLWQSFQGNDLPKNSLSTQQTGYDMRSMKTDSNAESHARQNTKSQHVVDGLQPEGYEDRQYH